MADYTLFKLRGDTRANLLAANPILNNRELAMETDTMRFKVGDGLATYSQLPYGRNTGEYLNFYNVTAFLPLPAGYYYTHDQAISKVAVNERCKGLIVTYEVSSGVWYTERFIGTDVANWGVLANWEQMPDSSDFTALHDVITAYNNHALNKSNPHTVTKDQIGLGNAANTSDLDKPISTATQDALDNKVNVSGDQTIYGVKSFYTSPTVPNPTNNNDVVNKVTLDLHKNDSTNPHQVTKLQVGLGNADNTSDVDKPISTSTQTALNLKENTANKGAVNGYASLDETGKVPAGQLPSYVDDVLEYANLASFPVSGVQGKIYVALDTNKTYRWSGSVYIYITSGAVDSVAGKTGVVSLVKGDVGLGNVDNTSDADKPVSTAQQTALNLKADKARQVIAGSGLTGGGTLESDRTINVTATDDSITVAADGIKVDTQNLLTSTSVTKPLAANQGKVLDEKITQLGADLNKGNLISTYTYNSNLEVAVTSLDNATGSFTKIGHGLVNGDRISAIMNIGAGGLAAITVFPSTMPEDFYYVVESTTDTFKISKTSGGVAITFVDNPTMDLAKWHFEKINNVDINFINLQNLNSFRLNISIKSCDSSSQLYILGAYGDMFRKNYETNPSEEGATYATARLPKAYWGQIDISGNLDTIKQYSIRGTIVGYSSLANRMKMTAIDRYFSRNIVQLPITSLLIQNHGFANGTVLKLYKY